ncbi:MAG TPA: hypothetical protein VN493_05670 [Thermoanaerobaculia bacterium]|nr:hypothetical protein [Thermoanaerobaculia bacterium]
MPSIPADFDALKILETRQKKRRRVGFQIGASTEISTRQKNLERVCGQFGASKKFSAALLG